MSKLTALVILAVILGCASQIGTTQAGRDAVTEKRTSAVAIDHGATTGTSAQPADEEWDITTALAEIRGEIRATYNKVDNRVYDRWIAYALILVIIVQEVYHRRRARNQLRGKHR
jgi:hypothetical protein